MTPKEYRAILKATSTRQSVLCRMLGIHPTTASRWQHDAELPRWAEAFLQAWNMLGAVQREHLKAEIGR